ncbi:magnesium transporter [Candidatus Woesearchaeota archaeon]|nr:magnesium transporter [Candidatus Woesearchaeota archaeon]
MVYYDKEEIIETIKERDLKKIKEKITDWQVQDIAELITTLEESDSILLFRSLPKKISGDVFSYLDLESQEELLSAFTNKEASQILTNMSPDDRALLFDELPGIITRRLFKLLRPEDLKETKSLLGYPEESVGRMMTPDYVSIYKEMTVKEALQRIRRRGKDSETLNRVYIIDSNKRLLDSIKLRTIILADEEDKIENFLEYNPVSLNAHDDREEAVKIMQKYDLSSIPVIDSEGVLIGIVTFDDLLDVAEEKTTEDIQKIGAVTPLQTSYKQASIFTLYHKRIFWLSLLVFVSLFSSGVLAMFENTLSSAIALAFFIPLLIGSGGNIGSQSATLMIRAIATEDVKLNEWFKVLLKEIMMGLILGLTLGILASIIGYFRGGYTIGLIVGLAMLTIILVSNLIGAALPFILSKLRIDPAVASSPLITTIVDALGLIIYFTIAIMILP